MRQRWLDVNGSIVAAGGADRDGWWMRWPHLATYVFGAGGDVLAYPAPGSNPATIADSYARGVLPVVLLAREHEALHASAVLDRRGVTAFCAASGTGKSSLAFAVASEGGGHWADDTVILTPPPGRPDALSLPFPARVDDAVRAGVRGAAAGVQVVTPGTRAPLRRIVMLVRDAAVDPRLPSFTDIPGPRRFERVLAHAHPFELTGADRRRLMVERLMQVAAAAEICELRFGPSLAWLPALAERVRERMAAD